MTSESSEAEAMEYVYSDRRHGTPRYVCDVTIEAGGTTGKAHFFRLDTHQESYSTIGATASCPRRGRELKVIP